MKYYLNLSSPETYEVFSGTDRTVCGFRIRHRTAASRVEPGDRFICYLTRLSRWVGVLEVAEGPWEDHTPMYYDENDPFVIRFRVRPVAWLDKEKAIPIHEDEVWQQLSFTRDHAKRSTTWTGKIRTSLNEIDDTDARFLEGLILRQAEAGVTYPVDEQKYQKMIRHRRPVRGGAVSVSVPESEEFVPGLTVDEGQIRESLRIQALIAKIGARMGMQIWIPRNDKLKVLHMLEDEASQLLDGLPLSYDDTTLRTVEQIDVLWLHGRAITRAFEVEHTTSIYSGILRMADLLALQPNMDIKLHIVAPYERRDKVFAEIQRPVFSILERGPLAERCTYLSYESLRELAEQRHLDHLSETVLDEYAEDVE